MKIQKVTITENELCKAVEAYLATQGVSLPVESVRKEYSYSGAYTVEFVEPEQERASADVQPAQPPTA